MVAGARSHYDAVVLGARPATLLAAALLARKGYRVCVVRNDERPNGYKRGGYLLRRGPEAYGALGSGALDEALEALALGATVRRRAVPCAPALQLAMPGRRLELPLDAEARGAELVREFGPAARAIDDFARRCERVAAGLDARFREDHAWPPEGWLARRSLARFAARLESEAAGAGSAWSLRGRAEGDDVLAGFDAGHPFRAALAAITRFATAQDPDALRPLLLRRAYGASLRGLGAAFFEGGRDGLGALFEEKVAQHGGELRPRDRAAQLLVRRGAVEGVLLDTTDEVLGTNFVLCALDEARALALAEPRAAEAPRGGLLTAGARYYRYALNLVLEARGVPVALGPRCLVVGDAARPLCEENLLYLERHAVDARGRAVLTAHALLPRAGVEEGSAYLLRQRERVLAAVGSVAPFFAQHLRAVDSPHDGRGFEPHAAGALDDDEREAARASVAAEPMEAQVAVDPTSALGAGGDGLRTAIDRLLLVGPSVLAGLGDEGEVLAARGAVRIVTRSEPARDRQRRELWNPTGRGR